MRSCMHVGTHAPFGAYSTCVRPRHPVHAWLQVSDLSVALWRVSPELARCGSSSLPCRYGPRGSGLWCSSSCCLASVEQESAWRTLRRIHASQELHISWSVLGCQQYDAQEERLYRILVWPFCIPPSFPFLSHCSPVFSLLTSCASESTLQHQGGSRSLSCHSLVRIRRVVVSYRVLTKIFSGREHSSTFTVERRTVRCRHLMKIPSQREYHCELVNYRTGKYFLNIISFQLHYRDLPFFNKQKRTLQHISEREKRKERETEQKQNQTRNHVTSHTTYAPPFPSAFGMCS